ncbi:MAG: hypothetical protein QXE81_04040 [Desulfurococcaceae archaeon]
MSNVKRVHLMTEIDLRNQKGCSENPISYLLKLLNSGIEEFTIIIETNTLPYQLAYLIASSKGYTVENIENLGDSNKLRFKKHLK